MPGERGDHCVARFAGRANQSDLRVSQRPAAFCYKNLRFEAAHHPQWRFPALCGIFAAASLRSQMTGMDRISGICLECAAIFRHLPLTVRWGLGSI
jgi:hypothetical protein